MLTVCNAVCNNCIMQTQPYERINILIPKDVARALKQKAPRGKRSQYITQALKAKLMEDRQNAYQELLEIRKHGPKVSMEEVVRWVREDRDNH